MKPIPPAPIGWNKTLDDLNDEMRRGERLSVGSPELDWAREYVRSQIPADMRFPRKGDIYEVLNDMTVHYLTAWTAPVTGGGEGLLKKGDQITVDFDPTHPKPIGVSAKAVDYAGLEERMVPVAERKAPKYGGFYFFFSTIELNQKFKLVREE
jgi:hypothetical protein